MHSYRTARVHGDGCPDCAPGQPGHRLCQHDGCDEVAESQHRRHATEQEYAAIPEGLTPMDGICHMAVFTCGDHELDPICGPEDHQLAPAGQPDPLDATCPKCGTAPGAMCIKADGRTRRIVHELRGSVPMMPLSTACNHVHRADCEGLGTCICQPDDLIPERPTRTLVPLA